jgi:O-antigen/teichoic acid export membrane protein
MTYYRSDHAEGSVPLARKLRWTAQYQSRTAASQASGNRIVRLIRRNVDLLAGSTAVFATTVVTSLLGFGYWWVATHIMSQAQVGVASSGVATMTLVSTLGVWGLGTMLVAEVQKVVPGTEWNLISTAAVAALLASFGGGLVFILLSVAYPSLVGGHGTPLFATMLILGCGLSAVTSVVDDSLVGLMAPRLQLLRNSYMALIKLLLLVAVAIVPSLHSATILLACWDAGIVLSFVALGLHMTHAGLLSSMRPRFAMLRGKGRLAFGHNMLNLSLFLPRTALPIIVTTFVSAHATAGFYTAWMIFTLLAMVPVSLSNMLYAIVATDMPRLRAKTRFVLFASVGAGIPAVAVLMIGARPIMALFGSGYAESGFLLTVLCLTYPTSVLRNVYLATARIRGRMRSATIFATTAAVAELVLSATGAHVGGVQGLTEFYTVVVIAEGVVLLPRVLQLAGVLPASKRDLAIAATAPAASATAADPALPTPTGSAPPPMSVWVPPPATVPPDLSLPFAVSLPPELTMPLAVLRAQDLSRPVDDSAPSTVPVPVPATPARPSRGDYAPPTVPVPPIPAPPGPIMSRGRRGAGAPAHPPMPADGRPPPTPAAGRHRAPEDHDRQSSVGDVTAADAAA